MTDREESKKLERRARSLMTTKEIPASKMEVVRSLMNNNDILPDERYKAIIELLHSCPDREVKDLVDHPGEKAGPKPVVKPVKKVKAHVNPPADYAPTETSFYVDELRGKYRRLGLFRKRWLVRRNNRFGLGLRKRLIPTKKMVRMLTDVYKMQESLLPRLSVIIMDILNDEAADDPTCFNYLRLIRTWLTAQPLAGQNHDSLKWMERGNFEREFRNYIMNSVAFQRLSSEQREMILLEVETRVRAMEELKKENPADSDSALTKKEKESRNLAREKEITDYMLRFRSFLYAEIDDGSPLAKLLKVRYGVEGFNKLLKMIIEVLLYQRPAGIEDFVRCYRVRTPEVSHDQWNYSDDYLKKIGKDPESRKKKELKRVKERLAGYEIIHKLLRQDNSGKNILSQAAELQWRLVDKNKNDPEEICRDNFISYADALVQFFSNTFIPMLDGSEINFKDHHRDEFSSPIFERTVFYDDLAAFDRVLTAFHSFRTDNPTLVVSGDEAVRIMTGQIVSMNHVEELLRYVGDFFYNTARKLFGYYEGHRMWIFTGSPKTEKSFLRTPVKNENYASETDGWVPIPFHDCTITGFDHPAPLSKLLVNRKVLGSSSDEGVFGYLLAFCFQVANLCHNSMMRSDIDERNMLLRRLRELS